MTPNDRKAAIRQIRERLAQGKPCRAVSTSLIEAGVDVDFPAVWREEAGLDSILQAAGRCNREGRRNREDSIVHIFSAENTPQKHVAKQVQALHFAQDEEAEIDSLRSIRLYSQHLLHSKGKALDSKDILPACARFELRTVAEQFKIIEEDTVPVYIPTTENAALLDGLRAGGYTRKTLRRLQQDSVNVYRKDAQSLLGTGAALQTDDGFLILTDVGSYDAQRGLLIHDEPGQGIFL